MDRRTAASPATRWYRGPASSEHQQLRRAALLDEHDCVLAEEAPERFRVFAIDADDEAAGLDPAAVGLAALAGAPRVAGGGDELVERAQRRGVLRRRLRLAARIGGGQEHRGGGAFLLEERIEPAAGLADLEDELRLGEHYVVRLAIRVHEFWGNRHCKCWVGST